MIFISFRVGDGEDRAAWLYAECCAVFGKDRVFLSSASITLGHDYEPILWGAAENCHVMIAVIGQRWSTEFRHRLFEPDDAVRREIATALAAGKPVISVLDHGGRPPRADELPPDLALLANRQYVRLTYRDVHTIPGLIQRIVEAAPELGIGVRPGIRDLAEWSRERTSLTGSELPPDLPLLGRDEVVERMLSWLSGPPGNLVVQGQTTDEVAAFAAAVLERHDPRHRAVLVTSGEGWEYAAKVPSSFPAVVVSDDVPVSQAQIARHVIIARDGFVHRGNDLVLPRVPRDKARDAFLAAGVPRHRAEEYAGLARRSPRALIRRLSLNSTRPQWAAESAAVPLLLAGRWSVTNPSDHEVIARIAGREYAEVDRFVTGEAVSGDPLVHRSGTRWQLADPYDAWSQLMARLSATDLQRFGEAALDVLSEVDPVLSLPDPDIPSAGLNGVRRTWSDELRQGLAHGLASLGDAGTAAVAGEPAENHAARVVRDLLTKADDDRSGLLWRSLHDVLPLLAEASPRVFLDAVRTGLRGEEPVLRTMFEDAEGRTLHRHSGHTGLLWALETVAWAPEHSADAVLAIARLAEVDPGGRLSNRPSASLRNLLTHLPSSPIPLGRRPAIINQVRGRHPEVGWRLVDDLTDRGPFLMYPERPKVRHDWSEFEPAPAGALEVYRDEVFGAVLADLAAVPTRWAGFLARITCFPPAIRDRFLTALEAVDVEVLGPEGTRELWDRGSRLVNRETSVADEPGRLSREHVERLTSFLATIEPVEDPTRHAWLFGWHPDLPGIDPTDHEVHRVAVEALRQEAVTGELARHGVDGLARLSTVSARGDLVGWTLAQVTGDAVQGEVFALLGGPLADGWVRRRARDGGHDWVVEAVAVLPAAPADRTAFMLAVPVEWAVELLAGEGTTVSDRFWMLTPAFPMPAERSEEYLLEILARDRPEAVVDAMSLALHGDDQTWLPPSGLVEASFDCLLNEPRQVDTHTVYAVQILLEYLQDAGHSLHQVAKWEIAFAGLFHDRQPRALLELIAADPETFVELHQFRYLPTEQLNPKAMGFFMTGERLRCVPGQDGERVDGAYLAEWVRQVRSLLDDIGMVRSGDRAIGALISAGPAGQDGAWPAEAVRDVLELVDTDEVAEGFGLGLANSGGATWRGVYDGGQQERDSAAKYSAWADAVENGWPRTARVLRDHAASLRAWGERWDREAEDDHDL